MATKTKTEQPQQTPARSSAGPGTVKASANNDFFAGLQRTLGNQTMLRLFESGGVQAKLRISQPGDADEQEADRVAEQIVSRRSSNTTPVLQRKCSCGGTCSSCKGEEEQEQVVHRSALGPLRAFPFSIQRAPTDPSSARPAAEEGHRHDQAKHPGEHPHVLVVEDNAPSLSAGQMRKTEFLNLLQSSTCATADAVLEAVKHTTKGCPYIKKWLAHYRGTDAQHLMRAMHKYAPETVRARSAHEAIALVNHRVQRAALSWARTGKVSDLPEGIQEEMGGGGFLGAVSGFVHSGFGKGLLGFLGDGSSGNGTAGKVQRKSSNGVGAGTHDAAAVKEQLGSGHSLDGRVQSQMSSAFGYDFSSVRVHTDAKAGELSGQLNARAFTIGSDVAFAGGEYKPGTLIGDALIAHELAHVVQQGGGKQAGTAQSKDSSLSDESSLEQDADRSAVGAVVSAWTGAKKGLAEIGANALPQLKSGLKLLRCKTERDKEIERLGNLQYGFLEDKRKAEQARLKKEAEEEAKKKGLPPPVNEPKVELGDVIKKDESESALKGGPTTEWDTADQPAWRKRADDAWKAVVASVKGTELESVAKGVTFNFDPKTALEKGRYAWQTDHTLSVGMSWVRTAELDPKNVWENLAHEMAGHFKYGETYSKEIMDSALSRLSSADRLRVKGDPQDFFETYEYPETEIYASLWQRRYRVPLVGAERPSGGIHPDANIVKRLNVIHDKLQPEVAKAVLKELKSRIDKNDQILQRDKDFFVAKVKEIFKYDL
jgi:hypothetical protein